MSFASPRVRGWMLVGAVAISLRLFFVLGRATLPLRGDSIGYNAYAIHLLDDGRYIDGSGEKASRMPGYPFFLAAIYSLSGRSARPVQIAQCLLGALTCVFIVVLLENVLPGPWPLIAGLLAAGYFDLVAPCRFILSENLYQLFLAASFAGLYRLNWKPWLRAAIFGAGIGAAYLVRPEVLVPGLAALALTPLIKELKFDWSKSLAAGIIIIAVMAPWIARNRIIFGRWIPSSTMGGFTLYSGLALPLESLGLLPKPLYFPPSGTGELAADAVYKDQFKSLWVHTSLKSRIKAYAFDFSTLFYPFLPGYDATFMLLLPFWLAAIILSLKRPVLAPLSCAVLSSIAVYTVFAGPVSRYRQEYAPLAVCLAAAGLFELWKRKPELLKRAGPAWAVLNFAIWSFPQGTRHFMLALRNIVFR